MEDVIEQVKYGFSLWPFASLVIIGLFANRFGPSFYQSVISGSQGLPFSQVILVLGVILIQVLSGIVSGAGFFGGLFKVMKDSRN